METLPENDRPADQKTAATNSKEGSDAEISLEHSAVEHERVSEAYDAESKGEPDAPNPDHSVDELDSDGEEYVAENDILAEDEADNLDDDDHEVSLLGKKVLLIEDDEEFADGITEYLKELGVKEVLLARNAEAGLSYLADRETFPHIVLLELALIGMDGIQFLAQLRASQNKRLNSLPAVVITMLDNPSIYRRAANQKVGAFLRKPVAVNALRDGLHAALRGDIVEKPFSQPKSWLDDIDEQELQAKRDANIAKAAAKAQKQGFLVRLLSNLIPWSGKA